MVDNIDRPGHPEYELLTEHDLGVDLINPDAYSVNEFVKPAMHPDDEKLLEEEMNTVTNTKRSSQHRCGKTVAGQDFIRAQALRGRWWLPRRS